MTSRRWAPGAPLLHCPYAESFVCLKIISGVKPQDVAEHFHLSAKTINSYRYRIFEKLSVSNDVELTHLAIKHGLISLADTQAQND